MQDGKKVILNEQYLINLRSNLRKLIEITFNEEYEKLTNQIIQLERTRRIQKDKQIKSKMRNEIKNLRKKKDNLNNIYSKSIIKCGLCNTLEGDRVYYKRFDKWYCPKCYEENYKYWGPSDWEPQYPLSKNQVLEFLNELDKVINRCKTNFDLSRKILTNIGISKSDQKIFLDILYHYEGHCDCEIMLNAYPKVLADFGVHIK